MKSLAVRVRLGVCLGALLLAGPVFSQTSADASTDAGATDSGKTNTPMSANEAAGLPNLDTINRPAATASATVDLNTERTPSFHSRERDGTEVTEYRDHGKPTEIDVRSNFGTRYQMSNPTDIAPRVPSNGSPNGRVPSISLSY